MNAPVIISPVSAALDNAQLQRADDLAELRPLPPLPAAAFQNLTLIAHYDNIAIWRLECGIYYSYETGCAWTIQQVRKDIDGWRERMEQDILDNGPPDPEGL